MSNARLFIDATQYAIIAHDGQFRLGKKKLPYVSHPLEVANILSANGFAKEYEVLAAAVLHDVLEDTDVTYAPLVLKFGEPIANLVFELSWFGDNDLAYKLQRAGTFSERAVAIKLADLTSNIRSLTEDPSAFTTEKAYAYVRYACAMYREFGYHATGLEEVFKDAVLKFNLYYQPQEI